MLTRAPPSAPPFMAGPKVRIRLPPAPSLLRTKGCVRGAAGLGRFAGVDRTADRLRFRRSTAARRCASLARDRALHHAIMERASRTGPLTERRPLPPKKVYRQLRLAIPEMADQIDWTNCPDVDPEDSGSQETPVGGTRIRTVSPSRKEPVLRPDTQKKSVERQLDAKGYAWPTGRQGAKLCYFTGTRSLISPVHPTLTASSKVPARPTSRFSSQ
jgi:hypothetical protein